PAPDSLATPCVVAQLPFAYVGREGQSVVKVLAGHKAPYLLCVTLSVTTLKEVLPEF
ncbi:hypothetical protein F442_03107, partial [Phytophthora nicotianae P10297]